jgi:hypothetical protein
MRRNASPILVVLLALCCAVAMLHVSIALGSSHQFGDSPRTTQTVRSYYASVNSFLAGGDLDQLVAGRTSESDLDDVPLMLGAIRATCPCLRLVPGVIENSGDLALAQITAINGGPALPSWINGGVGPAFPSSIDSLRIEHGQVIERQSSARVGVLAQPQAGAGIDFRLDNPSHLKVAELALSAPDPKIAFVAVSGPGFVIPIDGPLTVKGNGLLHVTNPLDGTDRLIQHDEEAVITGEEILVVPRGQSVLRPADRSTPRLLLLAMVPAHPEPQDSEGRRGPDGPESLEDVLRRLTAQDGSERIWFGTIRLFASAPDEMQPGWLSMDVTRIVVPAREDVRLSPLDYQLLAKVRVDDAWSELGSLETINATDSMWVLETVRACWRGVGNLPLGGCAARASEIG